MEHHHFSRRSFIFRVSLIIIAVLFGVLTFFAKQNPYFSIDLTITKAIQSVNYIWFDLLMRIITQLGNPITGSLISGVVVAYLLIKKLYKEGLILLVSVIGGYLISEVFKNLVSRARPDPTLIHQIGSFIRTDSFPSGHVMFYISFFGLLLFLAFTHLSKNLYRNLAIIFFLTLIILIGPSRIYVGAHWFSDVLGAYLIGSLWLTVVISLYNHLHLRGDR